MAGFVYILRFLRNCRYYIGSTDNLERRLGEHKSGLCHTTRRMLPISLEFFQEFPTLGAARRVEHKLKRLKRKDTIERIVREGILKLNGPVA